MCLFDRAAQELSETPLIIVIGRLGEELWPLLQNEVCKGKG